MPKPLRSSTSPSANQVDAIRLQMVAANPNASIKGDKLLQGTSNYLTGADPKGWLTGVPHYARVRYQNIYPGIDLVYYGNQEQLEYDFVVTPGADPAAIKLQFVSTQKLTLDAQGDLILHTASGQLRQQRPSVYQEIDGNKRAVVGDYLLTDNNQVEFHLADYDASKPLIIDPLLSYSTYLGGQGNDVAYAVTVDHQGNVYLAGSTSSADFPTALPFQSACGGCSDAFVTKFNATGNALIFSTFLGGDGLDEGRAIHVDSNGAIYLAGSSNSGNFPTTPDAFKRIPGGNDAFVTKLNATGDGLIYSTLLGGTNTALLR